MKNDTMTNNPTLELGLFERIKLSPPQTPAEVDGYINAVQAELTQFEADRDATKTKMADAWGTSAGSQFEDEYTRLGLRIGAANEVLKRLQAERVEVQKREIVAQVVSMYHERAKLHDEETKAAAQVEKLKNQHIEAVKKRQIISQQISSISADERTLTYQMQLLGVYQEECARIFSQAFEASKVKRNGKK